MEFSNCRRVGCYGDFQIELEQAWHQSTKTRIMGLSIKTPPGLARGPLYIRYFPKNWKQFSTDAVQEGGRMFAPPLESA